MYVAQHHRSISRTIDRMGQAGQAQTKLPKRSGQVHLILPSSSNLASTLRSSICCHERDAWDLERTDQSDAPPSRTKELAAPRRHRSLSSRLHDERRRIGRASSSSRSWTGRRLICSSFSPDLIWSYFLILETLAHAYLGSWFGHKFLIFLVQYIRTLH
jgi:hypothetical protein